jgi:sec-independent protein translocase protein TatB
MFDFGFSEILLTSAIALVVLGPERLPKVARQVGNWMGRARVMARQLTEQLEREVNAEELLKQREKVAPFTPPPAPAGDAAAADPANPAPTAVAPGGPAPAPIYPAPLAPDGPQPHVIAATPSLADAIPAPAPPRPLHPNSPAMMHARDTAPAPAPAFAPAPAVPPPASPENGIKPANE